MQHILLALTDHQLEMDIIATVTLLVNDLHRCNPLSSFISDERRTRNERMTLLISPAARYLQCANLKWQSLDMNHDYYSFPKYEIDEK